MSSQLKVTFSDKNNKYQYDGHADRIKVTSMKKKGGKLYLGDRAAASMVQLKHRDVKCVVNADMDMHGLSKEEGITYLNVDPVDKPKQCLEKAFAFLEKSLDIDSKNTLICCQTGLGRSACVLLYYIMRRDGLTLADAHRRLDDARIGVRPDSKTAGFRPELVRLLLAEEKRLHKGQAASCRLDERTLVYTDGKSAVRTSSGSSQNKQRRRPDNDDAGTKMLGALKAAGFVVFLFVFLFAFIGATLKYIKRNRIFERFY